ncbi:unnamed protein product, partial [Discosporangium mesarthrocarpum]
QLQLGAGVTTVTYILNTTDDNVVETPDENITVAVYVPGMFPSFLGDLVAVIEIEDNGDGEGPDNATSSWGVPGAADSFTTFLDSKAYTAKLVSDDVEEFDKFGGALDSAQEGSIMIAGDEFADVNGSTHCGSAYVFRLEYGAWEQEAHLVPSVVSDGAHFGQAVQIDKVYGRDHHTALVGAPGQASVYVFEYDNETGTWNETQARNTSLSFLPRVLQVDEVNLPEHGFGGTNGLSLDGDVAVIGARGVEATYVYYRMRLNSSAVSGTNGNSISGWRWGGSDGSYATVLMSSDYDYDFVHVRKVVHKQDYGASVALDVTSRTLVVGSPLADYDKLGSDLPETYQTRPDKAEARARGKVYVYYSNPSVTLGTEFGLSSGTFMLSLKHRNTTSNTTQIPWNAPIDDFREAIETLSNVEEAEVTKDEWTNAEGFDFYRWMVTFTSEFIVDPPLLQPSWRGHGCDDCDAFSSDFSPGPRLNVTQSGWLGGWEEQAILQASDRQHGDRFGFSLALDKETLLVGAHRSSALATTTWDFETGDLIGWSQTGMAFALQPTYGDNPYFRRAGKRSLGPRGQPQKCGLKGRYFLGTYEARPGAGPSDYLNPHPDYYPGSYQGDGPKGTLTSQTFTLGSPEEENGIATVSFLVGGGCDDRTEYVELLADGVPVARATGDCSEEMRRITWDTTMLEGRAGQIRVVDASSSHPWGHINVDDFQLSWEHKGGVHPDRWSNSTVSMAHYVTREDGTARAGSAYVFTRLRGRSNASQDLFSATYFTIDTTGEGLDRLEVAQDYCPSGWSRGNCQWREAAKLVASDRRGGDMFAQSLAVNHDDGVAVVGAPGASLTGLWLEAPTVYTTTNPHGNAMDTRATRVPLPIDPRYDIRLRLSGAYGSTAQAGSGAPLIWEASKTEYAPSTSDGDINTRGNAQAGAVYVFKRHPEERGSDGVLLPGGAAVWSGAEHFKLQAHDGVAADRFGLAVSYLA